MARKQIINPYLRFGSKAQGPYANRISGSSYAIAPKRKAVVVPLLDAFSADASGQIRSLNKGQGVVVFSRSTGATIRDFEPLIKTAKPTEIRYEGSRRVENLFTDITTNLGAGSSTTEVTVRVGTFVFSMGAGGGSAVFSGTATGSTGILNADPSARTAKTLTITAAGTIIVTASVAALSDIQLEDVTGQANQNPSEYVTVGVPTGPNEAVNGDFSSDPLGDPPEWENISNTTLNWSGNSLIFEAQNANTKTIRSGYAGPGINRTPGKTYNVRLSYRQPIDIGNDQRREGYFRVYNASIALLGESETKLLTDTYQTFEVSVTATDTIFLVYVYAKNGGSAGDTFEIDDLEIRECDHGAHVGGVKYFNYQNGNTVDGNGVITEAKGANLTTYWGALFEPASENSCLHSEDISNAAWDNRLSTPVSNVAIAPDGTLTADRHDVAPGTNVQPGVWQTVGTLANEVNSYSVYVKDDGAGFGWIGAWHTGSNNYTVVIDLSTGVVTNANGNGATLDAYGVIPMADGWYRIELKVNIGATSLIYFGAGACNTGTPSYTNGFPVWSPVDGQDIFVWGFQLEKATQRPTSYIPTTTASVSRTADDGTEMFSLDNFDETKGMISGESIVGGVPSSQQVWIGTWAGDPNGVAFYDATNKVRLNDGSSQSDAQSGKAFVAGEVRKWAGGWGRDNQMWSGMADDAGWAFGNLTAFDGAMPANADISVFNQEGASNHFPTPVTIRDFRIYDRDLGPEWMEGNY